MPDRKYVYQVAVDVAQARKAAGQIRQIFQRELGDVTIGTRPRAASYGTMGRRGIGGMIGDLGAMRTALTGLVGALAVREIGRQAVQLAELGITAQNTSRAFTVLSGSAVEAQRRLRAVQEASNGTVDRLQAMQIANKAAALGMANTADELRRVVSTARTVSRVMGLDMVSALDNMAAAASNLSFVRLDQMGISATETRKRFNELRDELGDNKAFLEAMLEVAEKTFGGMTDAAFEAADGIEQLGATMRDLKIEMAETFGPTLAQAAGGAAQLLRDSRTLTDAMSFLASEADSTDPYIQSFREELKRLNAEFAQTGDINDYLNGIETVMSVINQYRAQVADAANEQERLNQAIETYEIRAGAFRFGWRQIQRPSLGFTSVAGPGRAAYTQAGYDVMPGAYGIIEPATEKSDEWWDKMTKSADEWEQKQEETAEVVRRAWRAAAKDAARAFESSLKKVPGLFGTSQVTEKQMRLAELGVPQNFADDYLRRLSDEVINGVDWENVDIKDAARRAGIDPNLPAEAILELFRQSWESGALFANPENLELINWQAVQEDLKQQQLGEQGRENIKQRAQQLGIGGEIIADAFSESFSEKIKDANLVVKFSDVLSDQLADEANSSKIVKVGEKLGVHITEGVGNSLTAKIIPIIVQAIADAIAEESQQ